MGRTIPLEGRPSGLSGRKWTGSRTFQHDHTIGAWLRRLELRIPRNCSRPGALTGNQAVQQVQAGSARFTSAAGRSRDATTADDVSGPELYP